MNVRWMWFDHFPPELALTREQKYAARASASLHRKRQPTYRGARRRYALYFLPIFFAGFAVFWIWLSGIIQSRRLAGMSPLTPAVVLYVLIYGAMAFAMYRTRTPYIRLALREMGYEICEDCGYWLRGLGDDVKNCPECGAAREPIPAPSTGDSIS